LVKKEDVTMQIVVCVKPVLDPDVPSAKFKVDEGANRVIPPEGFPLVINPYDAIAVEAALKIKEADGGTVTVLTVGNPSCEGIIKKALAMGADEAVILSDGAFDGSDGFATAHILAKAVEKLGSYDLVLCGRQESDWDVGMVGSVLAEYLGIPVVTRTKSVTAADGKVRVERDTALRNETYEIGTPVLVTLSNEFGKPRIPAGKGIIMAARKKIPVWDAATLGVNASQVGDAAARTRLVRLYMPSYERACQMIEGESVAEAAAKLAEKIMELR